MIDPNSSLASGPDLDPATGEDLLARLRVSRDGEHSARAEARRLARELGLTRRLLRFHLGLQSPARPDAGAADAGTTTILLSESLVYHLDACLDRGTHIAMTGWAFRPEPGWDARATRVTLLLRHGDTVYMTTCRQMPRPDVAALYAGQPPSASGGATGLEGVGFACDVQRDAVPADTEWKIVLRLECGGRVCEQFTGQSLQL